MPPENALPKLISLVNLLEVLLKRFIRIYKYKNIGKKPKSKVIPKIINNDTTLIRKIASKDTIGKYNILLF